MMGGIPCLLFLPLVDRTMAGVHDLFRRFSYSLARVTSIESEGVVKRGTRASGGEISRGLFVFLSALAGESLVQGYGPINKG